MDQSIATQIRTHNGITMAYTPAVAALPQTQQAAPAPTFGEAPCSVNGFFHMDGFPDRFQATGRGLTPQDAAANLRDTIAATRAALAPPTPAPLTREERVAHLLACAIAKAVHKNDWDRIARLGSAAALVLSDAVHPAAMEGRFTVLSRTQTGVAWDVNSAGACGCPDYRHRATEDNHFYCAHGLSVLMLVKLEETASV